MLGKTVLFLCALFAFMLIYQGASILAYEREHPYPSYDRLLNAWQDINYPDRPANIYRSYSAGWSEGSNIPRWIPITLLLSFFSLIGYLYYDSWKNEKPNEMFGRYGGYTS